MTEKRLRIAGILATVVLALLLGGGYTLWKDLGWLVPEYLAARGRVCDAAVSGNERKLIGAVRDILEGRPRGEAYRYFQKSCRSEGAGSPHCDTVDILDLYVEILYGGNPRNKEYLVGLSDKVDAFRSRYKEFDRDNELLADNFWLLALTSIEQLGAAGSEFANFTGYVLSAYRKAEWKYRLREDCNAYNELLYMRQYMTIADLYQALGKPFHAWLIRQVFQRKSVRDENG